MSQEHHYMHDPDNFSKHAMTKGDYCPARLGLNMVKVGYIWNGMIGNKFTKAFDVLEGLYVVVIRLYVLLADTRCPHTTKISSLLLVKEKRIEQWFAAPHRSMSPTVLFRLLIRLSAG